jgi:hypothetical protein
MVPASHPRTCTLPGTHPTHPWSFALPSRDLGRPVGTDGAPLLFAAGADDDDQVMPVRPITMPPTTPATMTAPVAMAADDGADDLAILLIMAPGARSLGAFSSLPHSARSSPPRLTVAVWDSQSAARLSSLMEVVCGPPPTLSRAQVFISVCPAKSKAVACRLKTWSIG